MSAAYLRALRAPFPSLRAIPTGGVDLDNLGDWFAAGALAVGARGELCRADLIAEERWQELTALARRFRSAAAKERT